MRSEPIKAFGGLSPATPQMLQAFQNVCEGWSVEVDVELAGDLLRFSFEGVFFPMDDIIEALSPLLTEASTGRFDLLDIEGWSITRYTFAQGKVSHNTRDLNTVLDYSGH